MGLAPSEFYALQYSELELMMRGHRERQRDDWNAQKELGAWMIWWLLLPYKKEDSDPISMDAILGRQPRRAVKKFANGIEAAQAFFAAREAELRQGSGNREKGKEKRGA